MKRVAAFVLLTMLLIPGVALAGSSTDAALGLGAFAVFNQIPAGRLPWSTATTTSRFLRWPADNPLVVGLPAPTDTREFVTLELGTDQGLTGVGLTFFGGALTPALKVAVDTLAQLVMGDDPTQVEAITGKARRAAGSSGPGGIFALALSAVDIACWDIMGKAVGQSVCALLGGLRDRVPTYASCALMRPHPLKYLAEAAPRLVGIGFLHMQMQCRSEPTVAASGERRRVSG